jgi:ribA/ribD-fused uncharacterized protein
MITEFSGEHRYLSNFWSCEVLYTPPLWQSGMRFASAEHAYQVSKCAYPGEARAIAEAATPGQAKRLGRSVALWPEWESRKKQVMLGIGLAKFTQNPELGQQLAATGTSRLIEGNTWHDNYWGSCKCDACNRDSEDWWGDHGKNYLGRILMAVRDILRED